MLTGIPELDQFLQHGKDAFALDFAGSMRLAPGLVDSPPTSMKSAPALRNSTACATAASTFDEFAAVAERVRASH